MEIIKRQRGRNIPFYFTITPDEYIEMKKADCEIDGKESADRRAAWHRQKKKPPSRLASRRAANEKQLSIF